jgi:integrase
MAKADTSANRKLELFGKSQFTYDACQDVYVCPAGKEPTRRFNTQEKGRQLRYYRASDCRSCALKKQCTRNQGNRTITREEDEALMEAMVARVAAAPEKIRLRKALCEHPFGTLKRWTKWAALTERSLQGWRHPKDMGGPEAAAFLSDLANRRQVAAATQAQALNALVFLYREVLHVLVEEIGAFERVRRPARLPEVLTREEVRRVLAAPAPEYQLPLRLLYGTGVRLMELLRLRIKDVDFGRNQIMVRGGKGQKDRVTVLPASVKEELRAHLEKWRPEHERDVSLGWGGASLPDGVARK